MSILILILWSWIIILTLLIVKNLKTLQELDFFIFYTKFASIVEIVLMFMVKI